MSLDWSKKVPVLRFKDDEGEEYSEWEEISLEEVLKYEQPTAYIVSNTNYSDEYETPVLTAGKTFVLGYTNDTEGLFSNHLPVILFDDFTTANKFVNFPFKVKSSAIKLLLPKDEDVSMTFVFEAMKRIRFPLGEHKRYWISEYQKEKISYPCQEERQKIANFLSSVDTRIEQLEKKKALLEQYKKGLMQKLFSQEIRFKDDQGEAYPEWEESKLNSVFSERIEKGHSGEELLSVTILNGVGRAKELNRRDTTPLDKSKYKKLMVGDIAYNSMRMWQGASGVSPYVGIVSPAYTVITSNSSQDSQFWGYCFKLPKVKHLFERYSQGLTSDTWNLKFPALCQIELHFPIKEEQQKIANFLSSIDKTIELVTEQINRTREFKKGLLQQMFV